MPEDVEDPLESRLRAICMAIADTSCNVLSSLVAASILDRKQARDAAMMMVEHQRRLGRLNNVSPVTLSPRVFFAIADRLEQHARILSHGPPDQGSRRPDAP